MGIRENIEEIRASLQQELSSMNDIKQLEEARQKVLGKKGTLTALLRSMGQLSPEERPAAGQLINAGREMISAMLDARNAALMAVEKEAKLRRDTIDVTEPRDLPRIGTAHPNTLALNEVLSALTGLGFDIVEGPEIELDHYNFELLNLPKNHPARDAQDTFYVDDNIVLRTHTSPVQARTMLSRKPPIRIACPGRVFRADEVDATHSPVFHQIEGLVIDKDVNMGDLKGTLDALFLLPLHRAQRRGGPDLHRLPRQGLPRVQGHRLDRSAGLRHGEPQGAGDVRHRPQRLFRLRLRHRPGAHHHAALRHQGHAPALPSASAWSASPCCATASRTCGCCMKATSASCASSDEDTLGASSAPKTPNQGDDPPGPASFAAYRSL